jgi:hypothetical protein
VRRTKLLTYLIALITLLTGALVFLPPGASADTAQLEIANEAWFGRYKLEDPQVDTCVPGPTGPTPVIPSTTTQPCGPTSPGDSPAPQSKATGHYVVASAGGEAGDDEGEGDTAWAAFQWDTFDYFGATAEKFVVTLHQGIDRSGRNQGDTYPSRPVFIQACNILEGWSGEPGPNPWDAKPKVSNSCIVPTVDPAKPLEFTFDVTSFADSWLAGTGHGFVIRPGTPQKTKDLEPFQITFAGYYDPGTEPPTCNPIGAPSPGGTPVTTVPSTTTTVTVPPVTVPQQQTTCEERKTPPAPAPKVTFAFTPAAEDEFEDFDDFGGDEEIFEDVDLGDDDILEAETDLDVIPTDIGSEELADDAVPTDDVAGDVAVPVDTEGRTRPISSNRETPFPWIILLLLPLAAVAFWGTGTALGPMGDPVSARRGGVSRVLAERQAAHRGSDFETRNR